MGKCKATDLRAGAALVIAGLMAQGQTEITNIEFILRGYSDIIENCVVLERILHSLKTKPLR